MVKNNRKTMEKDRDEEKTPHLSVMSQVRIRSRDIKTFDVNQDGSLKNTQKAKLSKLTRSTNLILNFEVPKERKYKANKFFA